MGLKYSQIQSALEMRHGHHISLRHLKRRIAKLGLNRRTGYTDLGVLVDFVHGQLQHSGELHSYHWMYEKCRQYGLRVRKADMRLVLSELDPRGVKQRQAGCLRRLQYFSRGPNFIWHLDSYDILKSYGICITRCIDGFSRKLIWLNTYTTSSDPRLIGGYYLEAIDRLQGCPTVVRGDLGTENGHVGAFQHVLVPTQPGDTLDSYKEGASTANQRIEYWWGFLCRQCAEFRIALFGELKDNGHYDGGFLDKSLIEFCCMGLIQVSQSEVRCGENLY
uniref:Integrase core domain-containing protein n=1 Tax=Larimichthys crocea TaxID=215358 RepID=A0A0F8BN81_LARCR